MQYQICTENEFYDQYGPIANSIDPNSGCLFGAHGPEGDFVARQDPCTVWTLVDTDEGEAVVSGFHYVNRIGYFITSKPVPKGVCVEVVLNHGEPDGDDCWDDDEVVTEATGTVAGS